jgi:hypothetical protein
MALKMPDRYQLPAEMEDAALMEALWPKPLEEINDMPEALLRRLLLFRRVKDVAMYGGKLT